MNRLALALLAALALVIPLAACADLSGHNQNSYTEGDVGKPVKIEYGKIVSMRHVEIQGNTSGVGAAGGMVAGGAAGSALGSGNGSVATAIGGAIIAGIVGNAIEKNADKRDGIEYVVHENNGKTVSVVQNVSKDDAPLHVGQRVMVQIKGTEKKGDYMRVLPAE